MQISLMKKRCTPPIERDVFYEKIDIPHEKDVSQMKYKYPLRKRDIPREKKYAPYEKQIPEMQEITIQTFRTFCGWEEIIPLVFHCTPHQWLEKQEGIEEVL